MADGDPLIDHLLRRAGFGARPDELTTYSGLSYSQAVDRLLNFESIPDTVDSKIGVPGYAQVTPRGGGAFSPNTVVDDARQRWLFRMVHTDRPLQEKMALFWHNYFATGYTKISGVVKAQNATRLMDAKGSEDPAQQQGQIGLFRANGLGSFRDLLVAVAMDPAMLIWLDGDTNVKAKPQENFGRELMELFSRGVGYYTEDDVYAAARVFTGWNLTRNGAAADDITAPFAFIYNASQHETTAKTFSFPIYSNGSHTIPARAASAGMQDGLDLIDALSTHPETAQRLMTKLYQFFVSETVDPAPGLIGDLAATYLSSGTNIKAVLQRLFTSPQMQDPSIYFTRYSWPVEFVVRALKETGWSGYSVNSALTPLVSMGQQLYEPPNVAGWVLGKSWFSTGAMIARMNFASALALNQKFNIASAVKATPGAKSSPVAVVDFLLGRLTADVSNGEYSDLITYASSVTGAWSGTDAQLQTKGPGLVHLILGLPEYQFV
jgi:uncharacterized protein (DUF1800 family)